MPKPEKTVEKSHAVMYNFESNSFSLVDYPQGFSSVCCMQCALTVYLYLEAPRKNCPVLY